MKLFVYNLQKPVPLAGYLELTSEGFAALADNFADATELELKEWHGSKYFQVASGEWSSKKKPYYLGFTTAFAKTVAAVSDWNYATYVRFDPDRLNNGASVKIISDSFAKREWRLESGGDGHVWINSYANDKLRPTYFHMAQPASKPESLWYWMFTKRYDAKTTLKVTVKTTTRNKTVDEQTIEAFFNLSAKAKIPFSKLISADVDAKGGITYKEHGVHEHVDERQDEVTQTVEIAPGTVGWALIHRLSVGDVFVERFADLEYVKDKTPPGLDRAGLVMLQRGGKLETWEEALKHMV